MIQTNRDGCGRRQKGFGVKRLFDLMLALCVTVVLLLPVTIVAFAVRLTSKGAIPYWSDRVGRNNSYLVSDEVFVFHTKLLRIKYLDAKIN